MPIYKSLLTVYILCFAPIAQAEIYKCNDVNGKVVYSDTTCGSNARTVKLEPLNTFTSAEKVALSDKTDQLICPGGHGTVLPIKLCEGGGHSGCRFRSAYLKNVYSDINALKNDISDAQVALVAKHFKNGTELWSFGAPAGEWDAGTGIRGYVVLMKTKPVFYLAALYQGLPNKKPKGDVRYLPLEAQFLKRCKDRSIMDRD